MVVTDEMINILWSYGAERWNKYDKDRLYVGRSVMRFADVSYKSDSKGDKVNIVINGRKINNKELEQIYKSLDNAYVDLETNKIIVYKDNEFVKSVISSALNNLYNSLYKKE